MLKKMVALSFAAALVFAGAACSDDDDSSGGGGSSDLAAQVKSAADEAGEDLSDEEAQCTVDIMVALIGEDATKEAIEGGPEAIAEAMGSVTDAMLGTGDATEALDNLLELDDVCFEMMGLSKSDLESLSDLSG